MTSDARKAVVLGASGLIGSHLSESLGASGWEVLGTYHRFPIPEGVALDLSRPDQMAELLVRFNPRWIFVCAAESNVDFCEQHPRESAALNVTVVETLCRLAASHGSGVVFFSSDYVFDGTHGPYAESDPVHPLSEYGRQKIRAEETIRKSLRDHLILRVTVVYGWERQEKNFLGRALAQLQRNEPLQVPSDQIGTPTLVNDVAKTAVDLVEQGLRGTVHVAGPDWISREQFAVEIAGAFGLRSDLIVGVPTAQLRQKAARPLRAGLRSERLSPDFVQGMRSCREALRWLKEHPQERAS